MSGAMAPDLTEFLQTAAGDFCAIPDSRPVDFESTGRTRSTKVHVDDASSGRWRSYAKLWSWNLNVSRCSTAPSVTLRLAYIASVRR